MSYFCCCLNINVQNCVACGLVRVTELAMAIGYKAYSISLTERVFCSIIIDFIFDSY